MKKVTVFFYAMLLGFNLSSIAEGALIDQSNGVIHDDNADQYWIQNLSLFANQTYSTQITDITLLNNSESEFESNIYGEWRMASYEDMINLWSYDAESIISDFGIGYLDSSGDIWTGGRYNGTIGMPEGAHNTAWAQHYIDGTYYTTPLNGGIIDTQSALWVGAWVVADPVPIPSAIWLLGSGLIGIVGFRKKFSKG